MTDDIGQTIISGVVESGFGDGKVFLSLNYYKNAVKTALGFIPYPGTLNLNTGKPIELPESRCVVISGKDGYGAVRCWHVVVSTDTSFNVVYRAVVLRPEITEHGPETLELVSPHELRTKLGVKDGDTLYIRLV